MTAKIGNRTGFQSGGARSQAMVEGTLEFEPTSRGGLANVARAHTSHAKGSDPVGSVVPADGAAPLGKEMVPLIDKLGERLGFERTGVRLYDGLLAKHDAGGEFSGGPARADLEEIRADEKKHFDDLREIIEKLGADPTEVTPSADVHALASSGIGAVIADPRITLLQSLEAVLVAELADNAGWELLEHMAEAAGQDELAMLCASALRTEEEHLAKVRGWVQAGSSL